jgi:hypothetical protein
MTQNRSWPVANLIKSDVYMYIGTWGTSVIVTRLQAGQSGIQYLAGARGCCLLQTFKPPLGPTQPPFNMYQEVQWPELEVDHWPPSNAMIKNKFYSTCVLSWCREGLYLDLEHVRRIMWYCHNFPPYVMHSTVQQTAIRICDTVRSIDLMQWDYN